MVRSSARFSTVAVVSATTLASMTAVASCAVSTDTSPLREAVTADGILQHREEFQAIADANDGTRASGTPGYDASADYVADLLSSAGYEVTRQEFDYEQFLETAAPVLDLTDPNLPPYIPGQDFATMECSGAGRCHS